jgi:hypothetical protein
MLQARGRQHVHLTLTRIHQYNRNWTLSPPSSPSACVSDNPVNQTTAKVSRVQVSYQSNSGWFPCGYISLPIRLDNHRTGATSYTRGKCTGPDEENGINQRGIHQCCPVHSTTNAPVAMPIYLSFARSKYA